MNDYLQMEPNSLVQYLQKPAHSFTKADIIRYIKEQKIPMINLRYTGGDGRLKSLNFVINGESHLDNLLTMGERVDGSSLFPFIHAGSSDLYVIPRYSTAFLNPFTEIPTLDILCAYYDKDGKPLASAPQNILHKAHKVFKERTDYAFHAMGELEYYIISKEAPLFQAADQRGYHESFPFSRWELFRMEAMTLIAKTGGKIKYGHAEVGNFIKDGIEYEQNEIEFLPCSVEEAADQLVIAKWILRSLAFKYGVTITFAPKITVGKAGSGMHVHTRLVKDGNNAMVVAGKLSDAAKKAIAGYLYFAPSLTAFGNTNPMSYFRLVPHQEAPTTICWGDRNRSVLVRVPLGWTSSGNEMIYDANPNEPIEEKHYGDKQTVEFRCPDGSADIYLLLAGLTVAALHGLEMEDALQYAEERYVDVNIFDGEQQEKVKHLSHLPASCYESAKLLLQQKELYTKYDIFPEEVIEGYARRLKDYRDKNLRKEIEGNDRRLLELVKEFFHCG